MKKLLMILPLALILCFMVGCQDKEAMAKLEEFRARAETRISFLFKGPTLRASSKLMLNFLTDFGGRFIMTIYK